MSFHHVFITGVVGFIGSNLADRLLADGVQVTGWDNLSTGQIRFLDGALTNPKFKLVRGDNLDLPALTAAMKGADFVFHFAANADIKDGWQHPRKDLEQNTIATFNVLEAMRANGVKRIGFSSTGSVYGEALVTPERPTPETDLFPIQTSLYGASKAAGEGLLGAYAEGGQIDEAYIFRFVSILGERYTHGHVFDFYRQLRESPESLTVLGNGTQKKSYLYVGDCINAILHATNNHLAATAKHHTCVFNLGTREFVEVNDSIRIICDELGVQPQLQYTGGDRGWIGDNPFIFLSAERMRSSGWSPVLSIEEGVRATIRWLQSNQWVYEARTGL